MTKLTPNNAAPSLLFMHLSDIHFRKNRSGDVYDQNRPLRHYLETDAQDVVRDLFPVTAILVTGDIAYSGHPDEYDTARQWLTDLAQKMGCEQKHILTVPGNHDVDITCADSDRTLSMYHRDLRGCIDPTELDDKLGELLHDHTAREKLYKPLTNYNRFASEFNGCDIDPDAPYWERDFSLSSGIIIRIRGLNSVLVSNLSDDKNNQKLFVGSHQSLPLSEDNLEYITLCHHPPDWLIDQESIHTNLVSNVRLQLFGHKHIQSGNRIDDTIRLVAGAVHPDRRESQWTPRYNFIQIRINEDQGMKQINYRIYPRKWHENDTRFGVDHDRMGRPFRDHTFPIKNQRRASPIPFSSKPALESPHVFAYASEAENTSFVFDREMESVMKGAITHLDDLQPARRLVARFIDLPDYESRRIVPSVPIWMRHLPYCKLLSRARRSEI